jgi:hypothetical protein
MKKEKIKEGFNLKKKLTLNGSTMQTREGNY